MAFFDGHLFWHLEHQSPLGYLHIFGHTAVYIALKSIDIMFLAHPVMTCPAEPALSTRGNLLHSHPVPYLNTVFAVSSL